MAARIAVIQHEVRPGQVEANRSRALELAAEALQQQPDIILFPEGMLMGYTDNVRELAEPVDGPTTRAFQNLLQGTSTLILYGLTERDAGSFHLAATLVGANGVLANYRKTHLWWRADGLRHEPASFKPGDRLVTFQVKGHPSGVMICYDGDFPEMTRSYANLGCTMLFWLNNRGSRGHEEVHRLAWQNSMIIAASCCCGKDEAGQTCRGGSNITGPDGNLLAELWDAEGVICADVQPEEILVKRNDNPWFRGRRPELYV